MLKYDIIYYFNVFVYVMRRSLGLRDRFQKTIKLLTVPLNEAQNIVDKKFYKQLKQSSELSLKSLKEDLKGVEKDLKDIICEDEELNKNYELAMSVPCIGKVSAMYLLM